MIDTSNRLITIKAAADYLGVQPLTIRRMIARGDLAGYRIGGTKLVRVRLHDVEARIQQIPTTDQALGR